MTRAWRLLQRWITYRLRYARSDLSLGPYRHGPTAGVLLAEGLAGISTGYRGSAAKPGPARP